MKKLKNITILISIIILSLVLTRSFLNVYIDSIIYGLLSFLFLYNVTTNSLIYFKTRKGMIVFGEVIELKEITNQDDEKTKLYMIEFTDPRNNEKYTIEYQAPIISNRLTKHPVRIWFNEKVPSASMVMNSFDTLWVINMILSSLLGIFFLTLLLLSYP